MDVERAARRRREAANARSAGRRSRRRSSRPGTCGTAAEAFDRFLGEGGAAFVPRQGPSVVEAIDVAARGGRPRVAGAPGAQPLRRSALPSGRRRASTRSRSTTASTTPTTSARYRADRRVARSRRHRRVRLSRRRHGPTRAPGSRDDCRRKTSTACRTRAAQVAMASDPVESPVIESTASSSRTAACGRCACGSFVVSAGERVGLAGVRPDDGGGVREPGDRRDAAGAGRGARVRTRHLDIADSADWLATVDRFGIVSERVVLLDQSRGAEHRDVADAGHRPAARGDARDRSTCWAGEVGLTGEASARPGTPAPAFASACGWHARSRRAVDAADGASARGR